MHLSYSFTSEEIVNYIKLQNIISLVAGVLNAATKNLLCILKLVLCCCSVLLIHLLIPPHKKL